MASLRLDQFPDELLKRLQLSASARAHELSIEIIDRLDDSFGSPRVANRRSHEELKQLAQQLREKSPGTWLTPEFIRMAREWGRE